MNDLPGLTKDDLAALRLANSVCFDQLADGTSQIRARRETHSHDVFTGDATTTATRTIPVGSNLSAGTAFESVEHYDEVWRTILDILRVGDTLTLSWRADSHTNAYVRSATHAGGPVRPGGPEIDPYSGLHADELRLIVSRDTTRGGRTVVKRLTFVIDTSVCPDNTARMIRPTEYRIA